MTNSIANLSYTWERWCDMVEVDIGKIQYYIDKLNTYSSELEQIHLNIFNQLKNSCVNWQDGHSILFEDAVYIDKKESDELLNNLTEKKDVYSFICDKYSTLGKKIKCNLKNKNMVLDKISYCCDLIDDILEQYSWIDRSFYYDEIYSINNQQSIMYNTLNTMKSLYAEIKKLYNKIEHIESEINTAIKKLKGFTVQDFNFDEGLITS